MEKTQTKKVNKLKKKKKKLTFGADALDNINKLGKQGWEAVGSLGDSQWLLLKRKIPSSPTQNVQKPAQNPSFDGDFGIPF